MSRNICEGKIRDVLSRGLAKPMVHRLFSLLGIKIIAAFLTVGLVAICTTILKLLVSMARLIASKSEPAKMYITPDGLMMMSEYNPIHKEEATWFAGAVLVPRDALLDVAARGLTDGAAADYFGVSSAVFK